jgi:hypothetical protein
LVFESSKSIQPIKSCLRNSDQDSRKSHLTLPALPLENLGWCAAGSVPLEDVHSSSNRSAYLSSGVCGVLELTPNVAKRLIPTEDNLSSHALTLPLDRFQ